jgi:sugar lactone lactonase YvrE
MTLGRSSRRGAVAVLLSSVACVPIGGFDAGVVVDDAGTAMAVDSGTAVDAGSGWAVIVFAGSGVAGRADGPAGTAQFNRPAGLALDATGNLFVADNGNRAVRKVDPNGNVTTIASTGLIDPTAVAVDRAGNVYVSDTSEQCVFVIRPGGTPQRFAGTCVMGQMGFTRCYDSGPGTVGPGVFGGPSGLVADSDAQVVYIADAIYETIRVAPFGRRELATLAGGYGLMGARDGACGQNFCCGTSANVMGCTAMQGTSFRKPVDVTLAADRSLLIADRGNCAVRRIASPGTATTCRSSTVFGGDCVGGLRSLNGPLAVTEGVNGLLFVSDTGNRRVVKLDPSRAMFDRLEALPSELVPWGIAADRVGRVFVADSASNQVRVFLPPP